MSVVQRPFQIAFSNEATACLNQQSLKLPAVLDGNLNLLNQFIGNMQRDLLSFGASMKSEGLMTFSASAYWTVDSNRSVLMKAQASARQRPEFLYFP